MNAPKPTLVILAAGMGSRFGGLKQMEPIGPSGEWILDYSVYDAIQSGFGKAVFVIRKELEADFKSAVTSKFSDKIEVSYAYQELSDLPEPFGVPDGREKPWGTGHATFAARDHVSGPFAVINSDDFYGRAAFATLGEFLSSNDENDALYALVGYKLKNTLSAHGSVSRGVCHALDDGYLSTVEEHTEISKNRNDESIAAKDANAASVALSDDTIVSLNCWGFPAAFIDTLEALLVEFLGESGKELRSEFYLPFAVDALIKSGKAKAGILPCDSQWLGVTHRDDLQGIKAAILRLIEAGAYPESLWG